MGNTASATILTFRMTIHQRRIVIRNISPDAEFSSSSNVTWKHVLILDQTSKKEPAEQEFLSSTSGMRLVLSAYARIHVHGNSCGFIFVVFVGRTDFSHGTGFRKKHCDLSLAFVRLTRPHCLNSNLFLFSQKSGPVQRSKENLSESAVLEQLNLLYRYRICGLTRV